MSRNRTLKPWIVVVAAALLLALLAVPATAKTYKAKDLRGTYQFVVTETRAEDSPSEVDYCNSYGTITVDGKGKAHTTMEVRRCTTFPGLAMEIDIDDLGEFNYTVMPNGEFLLIELDTDVDPPVETDYISHGRIVQGGKMLLVDGTRGCTALPCPHPEFLGTIAIGAKE